MSDVNNTVKGTTPNTETKTTKNTETPKKSGNGKLGGILIIVAIVVIAIGTIVGYTIYNNNKKAEAEAQ